ncbi:hypothetical protein EPUL_006288 [Erysiphe pulchra]|uniref:C3H1-type domain-containing protein n=1 Tax=Erysiphe pulchra TaxID=225359 RepID=A0A2S4PPC0_9PEZI|nr:hypothetical protein EPUL_006288 [Erysiphe pulchra]
MARPQQYKFPPPPPPPGPPSNTQIQHYGYAQPPRYQQHMQRGGGTPRGGRGGNASNRGEFHGTVSYNIQHSGGGYDPRNPQQSPVPIPQSGFNSSPNGVHSPASYIGHQSGPNTPQSYISTHWQNNQHVPQHGPSQPAPLSVQNYHPNYAPQPYQQPHYVQQPSFQAQPPSYGHSIPPNQPPHVAPHITPQASPQQWQGSPQHHRLSYSNHRGRGGFNVGGRVSYDSPAPLMGPPIRMGFDNDPGGGHISQVGSGFPNSHVNRHTPNSFPQTPFRGYSPQDFSPCQQRSAVDSNLHHTSHKAKGGSSNYRGKNRGDFNQSQSRNRNESRYHQNGGQKSGSDTYHKSLTADSTGKKKKKRKTNTLGLTPNGVEHEDSEDEVDDIDEEARLVTLLGPDTPQLPTDLKIWLAERKKRFPTKAVREAAAEQLRLRCEQAYAGKYIKVEGEKSTKKNEGETKLEKQQRKAEKLRLELEKAERKIQEEISGSKRKRGNGDEGDADRGQVSDDDSDSSSSSDSDDKPEKFSSQANGSTRIPPPKAQLQRHCKYFSTGGTCGKKGKCRFVHDQEVRNQALRDKEANGGKMTLAQRLILNDTAKDDLTILKSIKYLKEKGLMPDQLTSIAPRYGDELQVKVSETSDDEDLNYKQNLFS